MITAPKRPIVARILGHWPAASPLQHRQNMLAPERAVIATPQRVAVILVAGITIDFEAVAVGIFEAATPADAVIDRLLGDEFDRLVGYSSLRMSRTSSWS